MRSSPTYLLPKSRLFRGGVQNRSNGFAIDHWGGEIRGGSGSAKRVVGTGSGVHAGRVHSGAMGSKSQGS